MPDKNFPLLEDPWRPLYPNSGLKPGLSLNFLKALILCFPVSSFVWAGIIYVAYRLVR
jgi:hypothetical protein